MAFRVVLSAKQSTTFRTEYGFRCLVHKAMTTKTVRTGKCLRTHATVTFGLL
uniref:Uncharacterized protein n=1 Tax=Anguilla anguilla TaxID=7936 RepID=A0A0E9VZG8_ANGAN